MASFVLSFFPLDVLDEIWDLTESVSEGFLTYFFKIIPKFIDGYSFRVIMEEDNASYNRKIRYLDKNLIANSIGRNKPNILHTSCLYVSLKLRNDTLLRVFKGFLYSS